MASCDEIDYVAWQDMNELPNNLFPKLIDASDEEDETDVESGADDDLEKEVKYFYANLFSKFIFKYFLNCLK